MFLLSPEADTGPGDLHAQVFVDKRVSVAGREARQRLSEGSLANLGMFRAATPAHWRHAVYRGIRGKLSSKCPSRSASVAHQRHTTPVLHVTSGLLVTRP